MKKTTTAAIAVLMLAGALSAISGTISAISTNSVNAVIVTGDGSAPMPTAFPPANSIGDPASLTHSF
jgi:hypothetical protein